MGYGFSSPAASRICAFQLRYVCVITLIHGVKYILTISDTLTLFNPPSLDLRVDLSQLDNQHLGDFALDHFEFGSDTQYPSHIELSSESYQNTPGPDIEGPWDQAGIFFSGPQSGRDPACAQRGLPKSLESFKENLTSKFSRKQS
jgi:hypothetical protein